MSRTKVLLAVVVGSLGVLLWALPAQAHNAFTGSNPKDGARLAQAPKTVTLSFLAKLEAATTKVDVLGPDGAAATAGAPAVQGNKVSVGVRPGAAGRYTVAYQVTSTDGHPVKGRIRFTVTEGVSPTPGAAAQPGTAPEPQATAAVAESAAAVQPVADTSGPAAWRPWLLGALVLLAAAAAGTFLVRRRAAG